MAIGRAVPDSEVDPICRDAILSLKVKDALEWRENLVL